MFAFVAEQVPCVSRSISFLSVSHLYILLLLGLLQKIGRDYGSVHTGNLGVLKIVYLVVYILFQAVSLFIDTLPLEVLSIILTIAGGAALVTAIITCIILFKMSVEIE